MKNRKRPSIERIHLVVDLADIESDPNDLEFDELEEEKTEDTIDELFDDDSEEE
jgi:hypothetical protein